MIFVDTSAWYAFSVPNDPHYARAVRWMQTATQPMITTDYVVAETLTLLRNRGLNDMAISLGEAAEIYFLSPEDVFSA